MRPAVKAIVLAPTATADEVVASLRARVLVFHGALRRRGDRGDDPPRGREPGLEGRDPRRPARADWLSLRVDCRRLAAERLVQFPSELARDLPEVTRDELLAAFREITLNAMEHGAGFEPDQTIEVSAVRTKRAIVYVTSGTRGRATHPISCRTRRSRTRRTTLGTLPTSASSWACAPAASGC